MTKQRQRGHGEGTITQRPDGRWVAAVSLGWTTDAAGKPQRHRKYLYGKTRKEAAEKLKVALREQQQGLPVAVERQTVKTFLERWLEDVVKPAKAPKTYASYAELIRLHAIPALGHHPLAKLGPQHVAALLKAKTEAGLSPRRVHHIRAVLRNALNQAVRWRLIVYNPAALVEPPRQVAREVKPFVPSEVRALMTAVEDDRLAALFRLALTLGLRQGEVLGLRWEDVDLDGGTLRVRHALQRIDGVLTLKEPKSEKSKRTLRLPPSLVTALRAHHDRQAFDRATAGPRWVESRLVFATGTGTPLDPRNVIRSWHRLLNAHGLTRRPFHTCRHTAASLLLAEGVPLKVVQEVLGHSLLSTTADIYAHLTPAAFQEAADAMERALSATG